MKNMKNIKAEELNTAIGGISDKHIEAVGALRNSVPVRENRTRFWATQYAGIAAAMVLLVVGTFAMFHFLAPPENLLELCGCEVIEAVIIGEYNNVIITVEVISDNISSYVNPPDDWRVKWSIGDIMNIPLDENTQRVHHSDGDSNFVLDETLEFRVGDVVWIWAHFNADDIYPLNFCKIGLVHRPPASEWLWIVEPTLQYPFIMYTDVDDIYFVPVDFDYTGHEIDYAILCEVTGQHAEIFTNIPDHYEDRSIRPLFANWLYDAEHELFGRRMWEINEYYNEMYPVSEFAERFPEAVRRIKHVFLIDSQTFDTQNAFQCGSSTPPGTIFFDGKQIIPDAPYRGSGSHGRQLANVITAYSVAGVDGSGGVGIVNQNGDVLVPVIFWEIDLINETTAFARLPDGDWGIIGFGDYVPDETQILEKLAQIVDNLNVGITGIGVLERQIFDNLKYGTNNPVGISWNHLSVYSDGKYVPDELSNGLGGTDYYQVDSYLHVQSPHFRYIAIPDLYAIYNEVFSKNAEGIVFAPDTGNGYVYGDYFQVMHHSAGAFPIMIPTGHMFERNTVTLTYATVAIGGAFNGFSDDIVTLNDFRTVGTVQHGNNLEDVLAGSFEYQLFPEIAADNYAALLKIDYTFVLEDGRYKVHSIKLNSHGNTDTRHGYDRWFQEMLESDEVTVMVGGAEHIINPEKKGDFIEWLQSLSAEIEFNDDVFFTMPILEQWNFGLNENLRLNYTIFSDGVNSIGFIVCGEWYRAKVIPFDMDYFIG
jgi:hypothetical protein